MSMQNIRQTNRQNVDSIHANQWLNRWLVPAPELHLHQLHSETGITIQQYIEKQFFQAYGATVREFLPLFLSLFCRGQLCAVTGIRPVGANPLFLEQYLDNPIELELNRYSSVPVARHHIAEIGNLAATQRGSSQLLFILLAATLQRANFEWLVFTATPQVRKAIGKLGFELHPIADARACRLQTSTEAEWGSYYQTGPVVVAGHLGQAIAVINDRKTLRAALTFYDTHIDNMAKKTITGVDSDDYSFAA
ncbi:thermostable hemolysin [Porticoccus sp.]|uniref:thermostable hemolysin n=1 Tax=Porticoccus sp. TaxID=2024853 RepID=UPI003F69C218